MGALKQQTEMLTRSEELALILAWKNDRDFEARDRLFNAFRPLIVKLAIKIANETGNKNIHEDLVQVGWLAMTTAVDGYKPDEYANGFSAYVRHPILSDMRRHVMDMSGVCRIGTNAKDKIVFFRGRRILADFAKKNGREATDRDVETLANEAGVTVESWNRMMTRMSSHTISLDPTFTHGEIDEENDDYSITSQLQANDPSPEAAAIDAIDTPALRKVLEAAISTLPERERTVIVNRLILPEKMSLFKLSRQLRLSKKHVREVEDRAKVMLRNILLAGGYSPANLLN